MSLTKRIEKARREREGTSPDEFKSDAELPQSPFSRRLREGKLPVRVEQRGPNPLDPTPEA